MPSPKGLEDVSETGVIRNTLASSQFFRMLGVDSEDLGKGQDFDIMSSFNCAAINYLMIKETVRKVVIYT